MSTTEPPDPTKLLKLMEDASQAHIENLALALRSGIAVMPSHALHGNEILMMVSPDAYDALLSLPPKKGG